MPQELVQNLIKGDKRVAAKLITLAEDRSPKINQIIKEINPYTGKAHIIGITGFAGVGKSCLVSQLIGEYRRRGKKVSVIAVDPNSPFTGGAILGDRIRMQSHTLDPKVFIRSMGTRGSLGGLAKATKDAIKILDAYGSDIIIVETAGVGQAEVDIIHHSHTTVVILMPGMGDEIQAIKAGITEIGDIYVINKADKEGAEETLMELREALKLSPKKREWIPPIVKTIAIKGVGIAELADKIDEHFKYLHESGEISERLRRITEAEIRDIIKEMIENKYNDKLDNPKIRKLIELTSNRELTPYDAALKILQRLCLEEVL